MQKRQKSGMSKSAGGFGVSRLKMARAIFPGELLMDELTMNLKSIAVAGVCLVLLLAILFGAYEVLLTVDMGGLYGN
jgi:ABC-type phosphate transport system ATPase subunit